MNKSVQVIFWLSCISIASASCHSLFGTRHGLKKIEISTECSNSGLPAEVVAWLTTTPLPYEAESLEEWSRDVERGVPERLRTFLTQIGRKAAYLTKNKGLNAYHDQLFVELSSQMGRLSSDRCLHTPDMADTIYAEIVSRLGADIRASSNIIRTRFESVPNGRHYSGNVLLIWLSMQNGKNRVPISDLLASYAPSPETSTIFSEKGPE